MASILAARSLPLRSCRPPMVVVAVAVLASGCALLTAEPNVMLSGQESVPAVSTMGFGMGRIMVGKDRRVSGDIKISGVDAVAAHIHIGGVGKIGPPIITLEQMSGKVWTVPLNAVLTDGQLKSYKAGQLYINVYSKSHKTGEIRGQLRPPRKG
jgi:hypothetical protein